MLAVVILVFVLHPTAADETFSDDYSDLLSGWTVDTSAHSSWSYGESEYILQIVPRAWFSVSWAPLTTQWSGPMEIECTAYRQSGGDDAAYGLIWGIDDRNYQIFWISLEGFFRVSLVRDGVWQTAPVRWTESRIIGRESEHNTLRITVVDDLTICSLNGTEVLRLLNSMEGPYQTGLVGSTFDYPDADIRFTRFSIKAPTLESDGEPLTVKQDPSNEEVAPQQEVVDPISGSRLGDEAFPFEETARVFFADDFSANDRGWTTDVNEARIWTYSDDQFSLQVLMDRWVAYTWAPIHAALLDNAMVEVVAYKHTGSDDTEYGLIWGIDEDNYCLFTISAAGYYRVLFQKDGEWQQSLVGWTRSVFLNTGSDRNSLALEFIGNRIAIRANEHELASLESVFTGPLQVGIVGGTFERAAAPVEIRFTSFTVQLPWSGGEEE